MTTPEPTAEEVRRLRALVDELKRKQELAWRRLFDEADAATDERDKTLLQEVALIAQDPDAYCAAYPVGLAHRESQEPVTQPDPMDLPEGDGMELVFPFVACQSNGGPYDDDAFTAGYQCGKADSALAAAAAVGADRATFTVYTSLVAQVELIAMHHGFTHIRVEECDETPEWSLVTVSSTEESA